MPFSNASFTLEPFCPLSDYKLIFFYNWLFESWLDERIPLISRFCDFLVSHLEDLRGLLLVSVALVLLYQHSWNTTHQSGKDFSLNLFMSCAALEKRNQASSKENWNGRVSDYETKVCKRLLYTNSVNGIFWI